MGTSASESAIVSSATNAPIEVEIFDNNVSKGRATVDSNGKWQLPISGLSIARHSLTAKVLPGGTPISAPWNITVASPVPDFVLDTSPVNLNAKVYILPDYPHLDPVSWPSGSTLTRVPSSGVAPYRYSSSDASVVTVNSAGTIHSRGNGAATITVTDSEQRSKSYNVTVSNVIHVIGLGNTNWPDANSAAAQRGKRLPTGPELGEIGAAHGAHWPMGNRLYWSTTPGAAARTVRCANIQTGAWADLKTYGFLGGWSYANAVGI